MITNLSPQAQSFLAEMDRVQQMVSDASRQVSSGLRVSQASDDPDVVSRLLQLRAALQKNTQITTNLGQAQTDANVSESALSSAAQLMDQAVSLASQGATATTDATGRQTLANQVQAILDQMVAYSQTQSAGRYVFSGDDATSPSYQVDLTQPNGVDQLIVTSATRLVENPAGGSFAVSETAQTIFDARNADGTLASDNVFAALTNLYNGLVKNDTTAITNSIGSLQQASDHLNISLAFYGDVQGRIQDATNFAGSYNVQLQTQISQEQDADIAAASLELSQGTTQIQAAFEMQARIPKTTLFDFLNS
jgi:flagellar hook-associated protein 3 FlgL